MCEKIIQAVIREKLVVIVRGVENKKLLPLAQAMYDGGIRLLEITYSANGSVSDEQTAENIRMLSEALKDKMYIGAGTVLNEKQVELTAKAGGKFIISPDTCVDVIKKTKELGLVSIPGAVTPSEIQSAHKAGADFVKLFPATNLGPDYIKAVLAPLSHIKLLAVGGIDCNNMRDYMKAGACGFGIGSNIIDKKALKEENYAAITELARRYVSALGE